MELAARTALWSKKMSEATLNQFLNNELEEIVIPASFSGTFPFFIGNWATNLKRIIQDGFPSQSSNSISIYTSNQINMPNIEEFYVNCPFFASNKKNLRIAKVGRIGSSDYDFYNCGTDAISTDIYCYGQSSDAIHPSKYWSKHIVFHGNDGNRVVYDSASGAWVIEPDSCSDYN